MTNPLTHNNLYNRSKGMSLTPISVDRLKNLGSTKNGQEVLLSFKGLEIGYGERIILPELTFDIYKGEFIGIIGPSGAGKTSFGKSIMDADFPIALGSIYWENEPWDRTDIIEKVGFARQSGGLMSDLIVGENLAMSLEYALGIDHRYALELAMLNMLKFDLDASTFYKYPHELSGGMYKKCMICFASIIGQQVIFLDEPLSGLDPVAGIKIQELLVSLVPKHTLMCITHQPLMGINRYLFLSHAGFAIGTLKQLCTHPIAGSFIKSFMSY